MSDDRLFEDIIAEASGPVKKVEAVETTRIVKTDANGNQSEVKNETKVFAARNATKRVSYFNVRFVTNINLGNFESAKIEKGLMIPIGAEKDPELEEKIKATDKWACNLLEKLVEKEAKPILESVKKGQ